MKTFLVTRGCGFVGSNFVLYWQSQYSQSNIDVYEELPYMWLKKNVYTLWEDPRQRMESRRWAALSRGRSRA